MLAQTGFNCRKIFVVFKILLTLNFMFSSPLMAAGTSHSEDSSENSLLEDFSFFRYVSRNVGLFLGNGTILATGAPAGALNALLLPFLGQENLENCEGASLAFSAMSLGLGIYYYPNVAISYMVLCSVAAECLERRNRRIRS